MKQKLIIIGLIAVAIVVLILVLRGSDDKSTDTDNDLVTQVVTVGDPLDIVFDFYTPWLEAALSTTTNPYAAGLANNEILSSTLRTRLMGSSDVPEIDPVLCHVTPPEKIVSRVVYALDDETQLLVTAKDKSLTAQALVTLKKYNDGWYIDDISCSPGEFAPEREFTFEKSGYLVKSMPEPFNSDYWHLIFEENGVNGNAVPLFFSADSQCVSQDGASTTCNPDQFTEASKARVYAEMTELGAEVKRLEAIE